MKELDKEFERLLNKVADETLSDSEAAALEKFLADPTNMDYYLKFCKVEGKLEEKKGDMSRELVKAAIIANRPASPIYTILKYAAIIGVVLTLGILLGKGNDKPKIAKIPAPIEITRGKAVASVDSTIMANFKYGGVNGAELTSGTAVHSGIYELNSGIIKLAYKSGATAILEAPCSYELLNEDSLRLINGKVSVYSPGDTNFKVQCPGVNVEDLGTEFSMEMVEGKQVEVHVFDGVVRVETMEENTKRKRLVQEGEAVRVIYSNDGAELAAAGIDFKNDHFIRQLSSPGEKYSKEIIKMNPVIYYPMDAMEEGILKDYSAFKNNGISRNVKDRSKFFTSGKFGTSIEIGGANKKSWVFVEDFPKTKDGRMTGMAWVYARSRPEWATIVKNWLGNKKGQFHFGLSQDGHLDIEILPENTDFLKQPEYKNIKNVTQHENSVHLFEPAKFPLNSWQHVAFVHDTENMLLYRNGKLVASLKTPPMRLPVDVKVMSIGTKLNNKLEQSIQHWPSHWDGKLDEIAIFNYAMSAEEIEYIYKQVYSEKMK